MKVAIFDTHEDTNVTMPCIYHEHTKPAQYPGWVGLFEDLRRFSDTSVILGLDLLVIEHRPLASQA